MGLLGFLFIIFSGSAWSQELVYQRPALQLNEAQTFIQARQTMQLMNDNLADLQRPKDIHFASTCESYDPNLNRYTLGYDPLTHTLHLQGLEYYAKNHHLTLVIHEYAHVIFRANIDLLEASEVNDELESSVLLGDLMALSFSEQGSAQCSQKPAPEGRALYEKLFKNDFFTFHAMKLGAYDELFADILAVLYQGRANAVYEALGGDQVDWQTKYGLHLKKDYRGRDFSYEVPLEDWRTDKPKIAFYDFLGTPSDFYNVLDPLRKPLWERYLKNLKPDQYASFIKAYLRTTGIEFRYIQENQIWDMSIKEMNERFWANLQSELAREGVL